MVQGSRKSGLVVVALAAACALVAGCGGGSDDGETAPAGAPAAAVTTGTTEANRTRKCEAFAGNVPSEEKELTYTSGRNDNDGVMGKLINETGATVWLLPSGYTKAWAKRECTLEAGASTFFSRDGSYAFAFRLEARDPDDAPCDFATCIRVVDPFVGYAEFSGSVDRDVFKPQYTVEQKENQENSFIRGASKVTVKREKDGFYDSQFPKGYRTPKMDDWAQFTVRVEGLINF